MLRNRSMKRGTPLLNLPHRYLRRDRKEYKFTNKHGYILMCAP